MALNPTPSGDSHNWNYSRPDDPGFSLKLVGTVAAIQEVQAMNFGNDGRPSTPKFWENSNQPVMNIRMVLIGPSGGYRTWTFQPASKAAKEGKKPSVHIDLFKLAGEKNLLDLVGKTISVETQAPPQGFSYGIGNPRPWKVALVTDQGPFQLAEALDPIYLMPQVLANGAVSGGTMQVPVAAPAGGDPNYVPPMAAPQPAEAPAPAATPTDDLPF
jgi:hypothetical protein